MGEETEKPNKVGVVATVSKKHRHRKKLLYQALKKQMEFYFSDVNISKSRFMNNLLQESPYVDLTIFLNFNKIKSMTTKVKDIANALQTSDLLKVTEDGTKVFRTTQPQQKNNSDECTIYVEQVPLDADHSWLIDVFQVYGPIDYVSIPKFKRSHKNKGFAFIEFKDPDSAKNAIAAFSEIGGCLSNLMDPGNLCSIRTFQEDDNNIIKTEKNTESSKETVSNREESDVNSDDDNNVVKSSDKQIKEENNLRKRKHSDESDNCIDNSVGKDDNFIVIGNVSVSSKQIKDDINHRRKRRHSSELIEECSKKMKQEPLVNEPNGSINEDPLERRKQFSESNEVDENFDSENKEVVKKEIKQVGQEERDTGCKSPQNNEGSHENQELETKELVGLGQEFENADESMENDGDDRRKKNRRKRKKHKKNRADNSFGLHILSKTEWKSLRNRYLNEQRKKMKELKQYIRHKKYDDNYRSHSNGNFKNENTHAANGNSCNAGEESGENISQSSTENVGSTSDVKVQLSNRLTLTPGLIVKVTLSEPVISKSSFKNEVKIFPEVKYIDVRESSSTVYLRFSSTETAKNCVESGHWTNAEIIKGDEEKAYWDKIAHEREEKLTKGRSVKKGRVKLLKKAEDMHIKHVWFE